MSNNYRDWDYADWNAAGLKNFGDFSECIEYVNQEDDGFDCLRGEWFYSEERFNPETNQWEGVIYSGEFNNYESPGGRVYADVYEEWEKDEYEADVAKWEGYPEYLESEDEEEENEEEHDCIYGPIQHANITGNLYRQCEECGDITLDMEDDE